MRFIILHPRNADNEVLDRVIANSRRSARAPIEVSLAREDYMAVFEGIVGRSRTEKWARWQSSVVHRYDAFILIDTYLGKATAGMVNEALQKGKPVRYTDNEGLHFYTVSGVVEHNPKDMKKGWSITLG